MKRIQKKTMIQMLLGFLIGRVVFMGRNPLGASYFVACFLDGGNILPVVFSLCLGMMSALSLEMLLRYGAAMLSVAIASDLMEQNGIKMKLWQAAVVMASALGVLSMIQYCVVPFQWRDVFFAVMEVPFVLAMSRVFYDGKILLVDFFHQRGMNQRDEYAKKLLQYKLLDFSNSFQELSRVLEKQSREKGNMSRHDIRMLLQEMSAGVCGKCGNVEFCMAQVAINRPENITMLAAAQEQGEVKLEQMPTEFVRECAYPEWFLMETNQNLHMARTIMSFENQLAQNRRVLASQMGQVGDLLEGLASDLEQFREVPTGMEGEIKKELGRMQVSAKNLVIYEDKDGHQEIHMLAATTKGRLVTAREAAAALSELLGSPFMPSQDCHHVIGRKEVPMVFVEDTAFYALTGVARMAKEGEDVSGDTFSCLSLPNGELLLALSDGMGSGSEALEESRCVIELLEQMTEAGFSKVSALKLINSLYMPESEKTRFATADVVVVNLYQGNCQFIKNGAAATWLWREDGLERIEGQALPVGVTQEAAPYLNKTHISSGDYVIMVTDGIVDAFEGRESELEELLWQEKIINPQELAEVILEEAVEHCGGFAGDDMSVVVAGIWERDGKAEKKYKGIKRKQGYHEAGVLSQG